MCCIAGVEDIIAAKSNCLTEIEVEVRDIPAKDRLKYLSLTILYKLKEYTAISIFIEILEAHFKTPDGINWCITLPKDRKERLAFVTGLSESTIQRYLTVGTEHRDKLIDVQNGDLNWRELTDSINQIKNPSRYSNEYDKIEKEREAEEASKKEEKAEKAKIAAKKAEQERQAAEAAAREANGKLSLALSAPKVYADKTNTIVLDTSNPGSTQSNGKENSNEKQPRVDKSTEPWLLSANIMKECGLEIIISKDELCVNGEEIQVSVTHQVLDSIYSSTFSIDSRPEIKIRVTIENYDKL